MNALLAIFVLWVALVMISGALLMFISSNEQLEEITSHGEEAMSRMSLGRVTSPISLWLAGLMMLSVGVSLLIDWWRLL